MKSYAVFYYNEFFFFVIRGFRRKIKKNLHLSLLVTVSVSVPVSVSVSMSVRVSVSVVCVQCKAVRVSLYTRSLLSMY